MTDDVATGERWTGGYRATHVIGYVCEEAADCTAEVLDELELRVDGDGIEMWVSLVQANYHVCEWRGRLSADQKRGGRVHQSAECQLMLIASDDALRLRSEGCREYCGVRAHLYADFPRASQQPLNAERLDE